jgi:endo-1,4-beta-xylanase
MRRSYNSTPLALAAMLSMAGACSSPADDDPNNTNGQTGSGGTSSAVAGSGGKADSSSGGMSGSGGRNGGAAGKTDAGIAGASGSGGGGGSGGRGAGGSGGTNTANQPDAGGDDAGGTGSGGSSAPASKKFVGNITTSGQVRSDFEMYWDQITPENEGKWGSVEATRDQMNWAGLDRVHDYAAAHGIVFKQHNFVWGSQQPGWLGGLSAADQKAEVEEWIRLFCERYPDVALIDVVNEPPPHTSPVYMDALGGAGQSGYDWIVQAFKWAHQYCPNAILILNDYNNIEYGNDNSHFIDIVNRIKDAGAPIDAVGAQAHDAYKLSNVVVQGFIDNLAATGLPVYITEYDIGLANDSDQQQVMQSQFTMFWNDDNIKGITLWGYVVGATWRDDTGLITSGGTQRPAMTWLMEFLDR